MTPRASQITLTEAKSKDLVPCLDGTPLHSLHNPRREAEVFASNHLAHLSKSPCALVLGLGFGYHVEEIAKILRLRHKSFRVAVIEMMPELARLAESYRGDLAGVEVFSETPAKPLWQNPKLAAFLLEKPVVIIHPASFAAAREQYENFLRRRAPQTVSTWQSRDPELQAFLLAQGDADLRAVVESSQPAPEAAWLRAFWECKHAE